MLASLRIRRIHWLPDLCRQQWKTLSLGDSTIGRVIAFLPARRASRSLSRTLEIVLLAGIGIFGPEMRSFPGGVAIPSGDISC